MNKYLLLRDNKQSGPYTVPEIVEIGIKPYDLVWLEGKSAAWRYPSEIEELKAHAPTTEEQPFDRFYKTREAILSHQPYQPKAEEKIVEQEVAIEGLPRKKVYINFPLNKKPEVKAPVQVKEIAPVAVVAPSFTQNNPSLERPAERLSVQHNTKDSSDKKYFLYAAAAAGVILLGVIIFLFINNSGQKKRLQELNTIVKQIQEKNNNVTQVKNIEPAPAPEQPGETIINPELLKMSEVSAVPQMEKKPGETSVKITPSASQPAATAPVIVTPEGGGRPVSRRGDKAEPASENRETKPAAADAPPADNLYKQVNILPGKYKVGMLGGISNLTFALTNNSKRELHKVVVEIKYLGPEKKIVNTQTIYFENVAPGAQSTIDVPRSKRGVSIDYLITDIKS